MSKLPFFARTKPEIERRIHAALEEENAKRIPATAHIRLSQIGKCQRELWAIRNGIPDEKPPSGRALMTFNIGSHVEGAIIEWLRKAGYQVLDRDDQGEQFSVRMGRLGIGHIDGLIRRRPVDPWMLLEAKTAKAKRFAELVEAGSYAAWNREYGDQIHGYMGASQETPDVPDLEECLAFVVNKDTSEVWAERIRFDSSVYDRLTEKATLALGDAIPQRPPAAKSQYCGFCKYCSRNAYCWSAVAGVEFDA